MMIGQSIPSRGVTFACCFRWPLAVGWDWIVIPTWHEEARFGRATCLAIVLGPIEVSVSVFWS